MSLPEIKSFYSTRNKKLQLMLQVIVATWDATLPKKSVATHVATI
jgi:hypothetical protein